MSGYFNPRPPRGGATADSSSLLGMVVVFQSTPPARGATSLFKVGKTSNALFQSTPPARGATAPLHHGHAALGISIHAPREGGRQHGWPKSRRQANFNPRPPRGGRRYCILSCGRFMLPFQSTPPARGATPAFRPKGQTGGISIHAPREGGDNNHGTIFTGALQNFNPRPPRGGRLRRSL